jgi:hypothetical protein
MRRAGKMFKEELAVVENYMVEMLDIIQQRTDYHERQDLLDRTAFMEKELALIRHTMANMNDDESI